MGLREGRRPWRMTSFASALMACALVIASGYFAGRVKVISTAGAGPSALGAFIGQFSLPALLFKELATLPFASIDVRLLLSITIAKAGVFFGVLVCSMLLESRQSGDARTMRRLVAVSASRASFCTQSNDFALGLPVMAALYKESNPSMVSMLYLLSPVSLLMLNPGSEKGASMSLQLVSLAMKCVKERVHSSRTRREMISRPKMSRNE